MHDARNLSDKLAGTGFADGYWWSNDALRLHYRDYPANDLGSDALPPVLCIPGLTRNVRDFELLAPRLAGPRRVVVAELRGRGESAYAKDPMSYAPLVYLQDLEALIAALGFARFVLIGTSLGGILTMLLAATGRDRVAGAVLNDIGPEIDAAGLARIRTYVGKGSWQPTWMHAARAVAEANASIYPDYDLEDWLRLAKRLYRLAPSGRIVLDYDMKIAEPIRVSGNEAAPDMWPALDALQDKPVLVVHGERSDILSAKTAAKMQQRLSDCELVTVARVGHAPTLDEPDVVAAIERLLARVDA